MMIVPTTAFTFHPLTVACIVGARYGASFLTLTAIAAAGFVLYPVAMSETKTKRGCPTG